jgi:hypothetical protein
VVMIQVSTPEIRHQGDRARVFIMACRLHLPPLSRGDRAGSGAAAGVA